MNRKRHASQIISFLLILILLLTGCSAPNKSADNAATQAETTSPSTQPSTQPDAFELLPDMDCGGSPLRTITEHDIWWQLTDITTEEMNGEVVNDAIYQRNTQLEERFNVKLDVTYTASGAAFNVIKKSVLAQDDAFDFVMPKLSDAVKLASLGLLSEMDGIPNLDLSGEGWDHNAVRELSINNKLYCAVSDISLGRNEAIWIYMFNKRLAKDYSVENLYDTVKAGKWTFDKYHEIATSISKDLDGDGKMTKADQFGTVTHDGNYYGLMIASGETVAAKDANDLPILTLNNERFTDIYDKIVTLMSDENNVSSESRTGERTEVIFNSDRALFCGQVLACVRLYRAMESDFGILPLPKYNEEQENYYSYSIPTDIYVSAVPVTCSDPAKTGLLLQGLTILSKKYVTPAYYDISINGKYARDTESIEMLDIILNNVRYDLGNIYDWGGIYSGMVSRMIGKKDFASFYESKEANALTQIQKTITEYEG